MYLRNRAKRQTFRFAGAMRKKPTPAEACLRRALNAASKGLYRWQFQSVLGGFIADFYCAAAKLVVEVDGSAHDGREGYDGNRDAVLRDRFKILTIRFTNDQVLNDTASVVDQIMRFCRSSAPPKRKKASVGRTKNLP